MRILHISDVHVQVDYEHAVWASIGWRRVVAQIELKLARRARRFREAPETLAALLREAEIGGYDHVILSGDLTALAVDEEFERVRKALGALADRPDRLTVVPGNHDVFTPGSVRKRRFEKWFGHLLHSDLPRYQVEGPWPVVRLLGEEHAIVGLNSARVPVVPGIAAGRVGDDQLAALIAACADPAMRGRNVLVVVHHAPLRPDGRLDRRIHGLLDADRLIEACRIAGAQAIFCGHIHHRYDYAIEGGPLIVCGGSSTALRREGYVLVDSRPGQNLVVENRSLERLRGEPEDGALPDPVVVTG